MTFTNPLALILLVTLPIVWYIGFPRHKFRRNRDISSLFLRTVILILLVFSLAGLEIVQAVDKLAVVFLVDVSDSIGVEVQEKEFDYIQQALEEKPADDEAAIILFGSNPLVERSFNTIRELDTFQSTPVTTNTDIASAIQMGLSMFPADASRRIVILSDGQATQGNAEAKAQLAAATGVEISYVTFFRDPVPDVRITNLEAPARVAEGQEFDVAVTIESEVDTDATLRIFSESALVYEDRVDLQEGSNNFTLSQRSDIRGFLDFSAQIVVPDANDNFRQNNQFSAFSQVLGPPRILLIAEEPSDITHLLPALENSGVEVDVIRPSNLSLSLTILAAYKSVIIVNVPATLIPDEQMELIDSYIKNLGGGLVFVGGPESYGPGGYFQTPLEKVLPVETQIRDQQRLPQLTIAYLIDRSGSMAATGSSGIPNIELAKEAIIRSIEFLQPTDRAGVASFDTGGSWIAPIQDILDRRQLQRQVATLRSGGGTDILAGMNLVSFDIVEEESERKHIILLTDGGASQSGLLELADRLYNDDGVTISVIAIGQNAASFLEPLANRANGNFHKVASVEQIPTILTLETVLATRSYIVEETTPPIQTAFSPILNGINAVPNLQGYIATTKKDAAQVILRSPEPFEDPILASWQYGLGRVVAFTSDATSRWANSWVTWENFPRFWGQTVTWTITEGASNNLETRIEMEGENARVVVDARNNEGAFLNGLNLQASLISPDGEGNVVNLRQIAPGQYEAVFNPDDEGAYFLAINGSGTTVTDDGQSIDLAFNEVSGWVMTYSPEYNATVTDDSLLATIAEITGGRSLAEEPNTVFEHNLDERTASSPIRPWLLIAALILLPFDIAVRRLIITRSDLQRARNAILRPREVVIERSETMSSLIGVRDRVRSTQEQQTTGVEIMPNPQASTVSQLRQKSSRTTSTTESAQFKPPVNSPNQKPPTPQRAKVSEAEEEGNIGSRLLKRKRSRPEE